MTTPTEKRTVFSVWYRALLPDGSLWCESSDAVEVYHRGKGHNCRYEKLTIWMVKGEWEIWLP